LIDAQTNVVMADEIANQLKGCAFSAGMKIERPVLVRFDCPVYRQVRRSRADAQRRREEFAATERIRKAAETAQERHAEHLSELLQRLQEQADRDPDVNMIDLLKTFPEADRGELYAAIFATAEKHADTRSIVVGSGSELLWYDPQALDAPTRRYTLPDIVGALRSVQTDLDPTGGRRLLIGAAGGVHELDPDANESPTTYRTGTDRETRGGVNAVTFAGERIIASHSELGLLAWQRGEDQPAERLFRDRTEDVTAVRAVRFSDGHLFFSIDNVVYRAGPNLDAGELAVFTGSTAIITAVCPARDGIYAGNANGELLHWSTDAPAEPKVLSASRQRAAESVVMLDLGGMGRLFYTDTSLAVFARVVGDSFICRYEAGGQTIRRVEVAPDLIVATNDVRDRIICWNPGEPLKPYGVATVSRLTTHSIQDVCLIPFA